MTSLPWSTDTLFVRTHFADEEAWRALAVAVGTPSEDGFLANLHVVDDPAHHDLTPARVAALATGHRLVVVADRTAMTAPDLPLLVLHRGGAGWEELRVVAEELWSIENNISLANMGWEEFTGNADDDGVFRGF
ncbi:DUF6924 domain-containing protein [Umezawaea endophytica]|uniref:DUF6924 domain-containing protein n=1 Tax=Umezawaea endophytica TaxID=1654476 RepID=A0A9X2VIV5_9PSEU|nr:hypothetical protein [Umezawaea endophytica]MCS7477297.1 hypothetical protein [Umezawaea endophytica]